MSWWGAAGGGFQSRRRGGGAAPPPPAEEGGACIGGEGGRRGKKKRGRGGAARPPAGGAGFPVGTKWRAVAQRSDGEAVVVVNGAEGEPQSKKDRVLMAARPHIVLDGAFLAARVVEASRIVLYIGKRHDTARDAMLRALAQRPEPERPVVTVSEAPPQYVPGAETAAITFSNEGVAR